MTDAFLNLDPQAAPENIDPAGTQEADQAEVVEEKEPSAATEAFIAEWFSKIDKAEAKVESAFRRMTEDQAFAAGKQWPDQGENDLRYVANITQQVIRQRVASLYAKDPTVVARRRNRMDYAIWDGKRSTLNTAIQNPLDPANAALLQDIQVGKAQRDKLDRIGKTLEVCFRHDLQRQFPTFKRMMKKLVRRVETCGVGYLKLDFQRQYEASPDIEAQISDLTMQLSNIEKLVVEQKEGELDENGARAEELRIAIKSLQEQKFVISREGLVYNFPRATSIIVDESCIDLEGFIGANWIAERFLLTKDEVARIYKIDAADIGSFVSKIGRNEKSDISRSEDKTKGRQVVYEVYDKITGSGFTLMRGYNKYLLEPAAPHVFVDGFFPYFALSFNDKEDETSIYPVSTVRNLRHVQMERNRSKEALRQHRIAKQPKYAGAGAGMSQDDKDKIAQAPAHHIIWFDSLQPGDKLEDKFREIATANIDPNVYETGSIMTDVTLVVGMQDAHLGGTSNATATESSIAEDSRMSSIASNVDDLDDFLTAVVRAAGHIQLLELSVDTVKKIAGPGAMWPEFSVDEVKDDVYLEIQAGSSGRPNKAVEISAWERMYPALIQIPGISPEWMATNMMRLADDNVDMSDAWTEGLPSIQAINARALAQAQAAAQVGGGGLPGGGPTPAGMAGAMPTGNPATNPHMQGQPGIVRPPEAPGGSGAMVPGRGIVGT